MNILRKIGLIIIIVTTDSCVDPFAIPKINSESALVVDALITDAEGPHTVELTYSSSLRNDYSIRQFVGGATIFIIDDLNNTTWLEEVVTGRYETRPAGWHAVPGRQYTLHIKLPDGREYQSDTQELQPAGEIESIYFRYLENAINQDDPSKPQDALGVYIDAKGVKGAPNLLRWRWKGIYEILTYPELRVVFDGMNYVSAPPPCAGPPCICCNCWITEYDREVRVSNNQNMADISFQEIAIAKIPVDPLRFYSKYYIEVDQLSLAESVYSFWKLVQAQQAGASDLFQPNVIKIQGNVHAVSGTDDKAYGLVAFASVRKKSLFINWYNVPGRIPSMPIITDDCRLVARNSSNTRPPFW